MWSTLGDHSAVWADLLISECVKQPNDNAKCDVQSKYGPIKCDVLVIDGDGAKKPRGHIGSQFDGHPFVANSKNSKTPRLPFLTSELTLHFVW